MLTRWDDFSRTLSALDEFRRRINRTLEEPNYPPQSQQGSMSAEHFWPRINLYDDGTKVVLDAEMPGISEQDIHLSLNQNVLSLNGERKVDAPKNYAIHRQERVAIRFARSISLPCPVDPEKVAAQVRDGVLTVTMEKAREAQPRQITIKSS